MGKPNLSQQNVHLEEKRQLCSILALAILFCSVQISTAQPAGVLSPENAISTAVPFLTIAPDGRAAGMGDVGVASEPDISSQHWNSAKYAFVEGNGGVGLNYMPWYRNLIPDHIVGYLSGYYKINEKNTLSSSILLFTLGTVTVYSTPGTKLYEYRPFELAFDGAYSRRFTDNFSGAIAIRYIHSKLTGGRETADGQETKPGRSVAGDLGLYYQDDFAIRDRKAGWALGLTISNIGTPVSYTADAPNTPIPTNLRLGGRLNTRITGNHSISFNADLNKLMVPTPPEFRQDPNTGEMVLVRGKESPESVILGMIQSFYDAPGIEKDNGSYSVAAEEFNEITLGLGVEYWYRKRFAARSGYFHQHATKGYGRYFTVGLGASYRFLRFDIAYLIPTYRNSVLQETFRLSLLASFGRAA